MTPSQKVELECLSSTMNNSGKKMVALKNSIRNFESTEGLDRQLIAIISEYTSLCSIKSNLIQTECELDLTHEEVKNKLVAATEKIAKTLRVLQVKQTLTNALFLSYPVVLTIKVIDSQFWIKHLESEGFEFIGNEKFVYRDSTLESYSTLAFQRLWNAAYQYNPEYEYKLPEDGIFSSLVRLSLEKSPCEGFSVGNNLPARILKFTYPMQRGDDVSLVQQTLFDLGFRISIDGYFSSETAECIQNVQRLLKLEDTGEVDSCLLSILQSCAITDNHKFVLSY